MTSSPVSLSKLLLFVLVASAPAIAPAHDFWIEPSAFRTTTGQNVTIGLRVGQDFIGDPVPRSQSLFESFVVRDAAKEWPLNGFENQDPAGILRVEHEGVTTVSYRSKANPLELPAEKFEKFLHDEGLEKIAAARKARGESGKADHEVFFRYAKTFIRTGQVAEPAFARTAGFRYEIVPESNPWSEKPLRVRVWVDGKPAADALVTAIHRDDPNARVAMRTDARGAATLALPRDGVWLIKSVYMTEAPAGSGADWESLWASFTFER